MGELVAFKQSEAPKRRHPNESESAQILFFTGIRYVPPREQEKFLKRARHYERRAAAKCASQEGAPFEITNLLHIPSA
jgi:hypothetical protein